MNPRPSWPRLFRPQQRSSVPAAAPFKTAQVWKSPAATSCGVAEPPNPTVASMLGTVDAVVPWLVVLGRPSWPLLLSPQQRSAGVVPASQQVCWPPATTLEMPVADVITSPASAGDSLS